MNLKFFVGILLVGVLLLSGCTSETPRGDISAPESLQVKTSSSDGAGGDSPEFYELGDSVTTQNGLKVTLSRVVEFPDCGGTGSCLGLYVNVLNESDDEEIGSMSETVALDDQGNQYEGSFSAFSDCPSRYDGASLFPGVKKEGFVCLDGLKVGATQVKVILEVGIIGSSKLVYLVDPVQIEKLEHSIEFAITEVDATFTPSSFGGYGSLSGVSYSLKNVGETVISDVTYDYILRKKTLQISSDDGLSIPIFSLAPGETDEGSLLIYKSLDQGGEYTIDAIVYVSGKEAAKATHTFNTK
jgi:hypothetical protein